MSTELERPAQVDLVKKEMFTDEQIAVLKNHVAVGASDDEFYVFLHLSARYGLDPFAKEIWCIKALDQDNQPKRDKRGNEYPAQITVGRDGLLAIAERSGHFRGMVSGTVKVADSFQFGMKQPEHTFGSDYKVIQRALEDGTIDEKIVEGRGPIVGAYAYVYRDDRDYPFRVFAEWAEHGRPMTRDEKGQLINAFSPWRKQSSLMIKKVAEANALRLAFRVSGIVAEGQGDVDSADDPAAVVVDVEEVGELPPADATARPETVAATPVDSPQPPSEGSELGEQSPLPTDDSDPED